MRAGGIQIDPRELWASAELSQDPLYQPSMDTAYHFWQQDRYKEARRWYAENRAGDLKQSGENTTIRQKRNQRRRTA